MKYWRWLVPALTLAVVAAACVYLVRPDLFKREKKLEEKVRPPVAARIGFYPLDADPLLRQVNSYLGQATPPSFKGTVVALMVPHAGYQYSGQVAANAYALLAGRSFETVFIIGPAHRAYVRGAAVDRVDAYQTPLGKVSVSKELAEELIEAGAFIYYDSTAHAQEHSIEVQLPFLQAVLQDFKIVPVVMGECSWDYVQDLAGALAKVAVGRNVLIITSSDLSHYHPYDEAVKLDKAGLAVVEKLNSRKLFELLENGRTEMCGAASVLAVIEASKRLGADGAKVLAYANSGDVTGDKSGVVGYSAVVFFKKGELQSERWLNQAEEKELLAIARQTLESYFETGKAPDFEVKSSQLKEPYGAFVTLKKNGQLRGCIGHLEADKPIYQVVSEMAISAAFQDPRFPPLEKAELDEVAIAISVLSPFERVKNVEEIVVGRDGLLIKKGFSSGLLLPQVPVEWGWDRDEFLRQVCRKAGLPPDAWPDAELYRFSAQVFGESAE